MKIEIDNTEIRLDGTTIKTVISGEYPRIIDEFYLADDTVQTQIDNIIIHPNTYKKRVFNFKDESYLKKQIKDKNRTKYDIAKDFNVNESSIRPYVKEYNIKKPLEDKEHMEKLYEEHDSMKSIAKKLDCPQYKVKISLEQKGIIDPPYKQNEN